MTTERLNIVRDLWWLMPSGSNAIINEVGQYAERNVDFYESVRNSGDSRYLVNTIPSGSYYFRCDTSGIVPTDVTLSYCAKSVAGSLDYLQIGTYINDVYLGKLGQWIALADPVQQTQTIELTNIQRRAILDARVNGYYDNIRTQFMGLDQFNGSGNNPTTNAELHGIEITYNSNNNQSYNVEISTSGTNTSIYPTGVYQTNSYWRDELSNTANTSWHTKLSAPATGIAVDTTYLYSYNDIDLHNNLPSGYLGLYYNTDSFADSSYINYASLTLRLQSPPSSVPNNRDFYEVYGLTDQISVGSKVVLWGPGYIVANSGFQNFTTNLRFLDPSLSSSVARSGNLADSLYQTGRTFKNLELRIKGLPSGTSISAAELILSGTLSSSDNITLYTGGKVSNSGIRTLYIGNSTAISGQNNLYIGSANTEIGEINLHTSGYDEIFDFTVLMVSGVAPTSSGNFDLYISGQPGSGNSSIPLYIGNAESKNSGVNLYISGSEEAISNVNLYTKAIGRASGNLDFFTTSTGTKSGVLNLVLINQENLRNSGVALTLWNSYSAATSGFNLSLLGASQITTSGSVNLFMSRESESIAHALPLVLANWNTKESGVALAIGGGQPIVEDIELFVSGKHVPTSTTNLYTSGF